MGTVNYLAVVVAAISNMVIGFLWYGPLFGKAWAKMMGWSEEHMAAMKAKGGVGKSYALMVLSALVMSYVVAHLVLFGSTATGMFGVAAGMQGTFWSWLGLVATTTLSSVLWEGKPWKLWVLNNGYWLVSLLVMGAIFGGWQ